MQLMSNGETNIHTPSHVRLPLRPLGENESPLGKRQGGECRFAVGWRSVDDGCRSALRQLEVRTKSVKATITQTHKTERQEPSSETARGEHERSLS